MARGNQMGSVMGTSEIPFLPLLSWVSTDRRLALSFWDSMRLPKGLKFSHEIIVC